MSKRYAEWVEVLPGKGAVKDAARALLTIAGDPSLVRTESNGTTFLVPPWVAEEFTRPVEQPEPVKRRPRAKKSEEDA